MSDYWNIYANRLKVHGSSKKDATYRREARSLLQKLPDNLSYHTATIFDQEHGYNISSEDMCAYATQRKVAIINSDNLDEKYIFSLPGEDIEHGSLVYWMDNYWLVTERDANTTLYTRAKLIQCNHLLKWVSDDGIIYEQWCRVEDGTKLKCSLYTIVWYVGNDMQKEFP